MKNHSSKLGYINIRSLLPSIEDFKHFITSNNFDFVGVSETWLSDLTNYEDIKINGYESIYQNKQGRGGGVGLVVKNCYNFKRIENEYTNNSNFEQIWIHICVDRVDFILGCVYRPPHYNQSAFLRDFDNILASFAPFYDRICCVGDLNINYLNFSSREVMELNCLLNSMGLTQIITFPTRVTSQTETLIDLIILSDNVEVIKCDTIPSMFSDHEFIFCEFQSPAVRKKVVYRECRNYNDINIHQFDQDLRAPFHGETFTI